MWTFSLISISFSPQVFRSKLDSDPGLSVCQPKSGSVSPLQQGAATLGRNSSSKVDQVTRGLHQWIYFQQQTFMYLMFSRCLCRVRCCQSTRLEVCRETWLQLFKTSRPRDRSLCSREVTAALPAEASDTCFNDQTGL